MEIVNNNIFKYIVIITIIDISQSLNFNDVLVTVK